MLINDGDRMVDTNDVVAAIQAALPSVPGQSWHVYPVVRNGLIDKIVVRRYHPTTATEGEGAVSSAPLPSP